MRIEKTLLLGLIAATVISCSEDESSDTASATTETEIEDSSAVGVGSLALGSLTSSDMGFTSASLALTASDRDANCTDNASAVNDSGAEMSSSEEGYAERTMYCAAVFNDGSPDSARGAMDIANMIVCELQRAGAWSSDDDFTTEGNNIGSVTIEPSTECSEAWFVEGITSETGTSISATDVTLTRLADGEAYDKKISFGGDAGEQAIYIRNSEDVVATMSEDGWAFSLDFANGVLLYESVDTRNGRRMRIKIEGTISSDGTFSDITNVEGFKMESGDSNWSEMVSISGNPNNGSGLATATYNREDNGNITSSESGCTEQGGCSEVSRITASEDELSSLFSGFETAKSEMISNKQVLEFENTGVESSTGWGRKRR